MSQQQEAQRREEQRLHELEKGFAMTMNKLVEQLSAELKIERLEMAGIDLNYLADHGVAYVRLAETPGQCNCPRCTGVILKQLMTEH